MIDMIDIDAVEAHFHRDALEASDDIPGLCDEIRRLRHEAADLRAKLDGIIAERDEARRACAAVTQESTTVQAAWKKRADELIAERDAAIAGRDKAKAALDKINEIRNGIIGTQTVNWSAHIYPLVAALGEAGYEGEEYEVARAKAQTLIEHRDAAIARMRAAPACAKHFAGPRFGGGTREDSGKALVHALFCPACAAIVHDAAR